MKDNDDLGIKRHKLILEGTEVRQIFEPVIDTTVKLVMEQVKGCARPIKSVVLVGGFGDNEYLRKEIEKEVKAHDQSTEVVQSANA